MQAYYFTAIRRTETGNQFFTIPVTNGRYTRELNGVGKIELEAHLPQPEVWIDFVGRFAVAMHLLGRVEDIWVIMDYEWSRRGGRVTLYGENLAYLLRDSLRQAPMGSTAAKLSGDVGTLMRNVPNFPLSSPAAFWIDNVLWRVADFRAGFNVSLGYQWGSFASLMSYLSDASASEFGSRYRVSWHVRGHRTNPLAATLFFVIPRHTSIPPRLCTTETMRMEYSQAYTVVYGLGQGCGFERVPVRAENPLIRNASSTLAYREVSESTGASDSLSARRAAVRRAAGKRSGEILLAPNARYWDYFELGEILNVPVLGGMFPSNVSLGGYVARIEGTFAYGNVQHRVELVP